MGSLKGMKWQSMLTAALFVIMGIVLIIYPETTAETICYVVGISGVVIGIFTVLAYMFRDVEKNYYRNDFIVGMMEILLGAFVLYKADLIIELIPCVLGMLVVFSGISKLQNCINLRQMNCGNGLVFFIMAVVNMLWGILLVIDPFDDTELLFILIGVGLLISGITDTFATLYMAKKMRDYMKVTEAMTKGVREIECIEESKEK
ncbi:MAG: DUF308 domain-containing protein [Lachnospiraceae bacterium]|nr:DUF308 domain-containing protein [Lachnospiraceae bacterium]